MVKVPQTERLPYVTLRRTGLDPNNTKEAPSELDQVSFTAEIYVEDYSQLDQIASAIRRVLERYKGEVLGHKIARIIYDGEGPDGEEKEAKVFVRDIDFLMFKRL